MDLVREGDARGEISRGEGTGLDPVIHLGGWPPGRLISPGLSPVAASARRLGQALPRSGPFPHTSRANMVWLLFTPGIGRILS
jgi:hypothetical protein